MSVITKDLGIASAYGYAKSKGYTGTEEEFAELMASYADVAQQAEASAQDAEDAKDAAITAKTAAQTAQTAAESAQTAAAGSAQTASTKASEASGSAQTAAGSATAAGNSATAAAGSATAAQTAAQTATTKASEASSSASAASTAKTGAETARTGAQTAQTAAETAQANAEAAASSVSASAAQIEQNTEDIAGLKNDFGDIIQTVENSLALSAWTSGYINSSGNATTEPACKYTSVSITSDLIGKTIYVSGSAWWGIKPYVFVGTSVIYAPVPDAGGTVTQYTDLEFVPTETGTLYINIYDSGSVHHTGKAYTTEIESVKPSMLPQPLPIKDVVNYSPVTLTMIQYKLLNGATGVITDSDESAYYVSDYTSVIPNSMVMITTCHFWESGMWAFYDTNRQFISGRKAGSGGTLTKAYCEIVNVPSNAEYIVIGFMYQPNFQNCYLWQGVIADALPSQKWADKKWALIGDSLTEHNTRAEKHYYDYIAGATGISLVNLAMSGTGYAKSTTTFSVQANSVPSDADVVTLFGSFNDLSSGLDLGTVDDTGTSTIAGCINTAFDNIQAIIPLANIGVIAPTPWNNTQPTTSGSAYEYVEMIKAICERRSIPFLDLWRNSNLRPWDSDFLPYAYSNDDGGGVHPDSNGHAIIAPRIQAFLETLLLR